MKERLTNFSENNHQQMAAEGVLKIIQDPNNPWFENHIEDILEGRISGIFSSRSNGKYMRIIPWEPKKRKDWIEKIRKARERKRTAGTKEPHMVK